MLMAAGLMSLASANAQTVIYQQDFEQRPDENMYTSRYSLSPGASVYGDWVNVKDGDVWNEAYMDDFHSGEFCLQANNAEVETSYSWDRGFKIANLPIQEGKSYKVTFWVKGPEGGKLSSWLSKGIENFDQSICTKAGASYGLNQVTLNGEWQKMSFVSYYGSADIMNESIADKSWIGNSVFPEEFGGDGTQTYKEFFENKLPEEFFFIVNMYGNGEYLLDDIKIEEDVTFNQATFVDDIIKLDFGYETNANHLAAEAPAGAYLLPTSYVQVKVDGETVEPESVEAQSDGFVYIFLSEDDMADEDSKVEISFTPDNDSPLLYRGERRPSTDYETPLAVFGFTGVVADYDENIEAMPISWAPANMVKSDPENDSFEIIASSFTKVTVTYDKNMDISRASAMLTQNGVGQDLTNNMSVDGAVLTITMPANLADGEYTLTIAGMRNSHGIPCGANQVINFSLGEDSDTSTSESVYSTNDTFAATANGTFPVGWLANDNGTIHQYGLTDGGEVWNYNWGGNVGGGGCRSMTGYSGDLNGAAIYWRSMNGANELGTLTFGEQVKDYTDEAGNIDPEMPEDIALPLEARKYQITIRMCAWKNLNGNTDAVNADNAPVYTFTLEDLEGNVYARFDDVKAMPNVNGAQNMEVTNVTKSVTDFTVPKDGYYMLKFSTTQPNGEYLLGGVDLITMPSKAAYYKQLLKAAQETAQGVLEGAEDEIYDGEAKNNLKAAIQEADGHLTSPSEINELIERLKTLGAALETRKANIDTFNDKILVAMTAQQDLEGTKYANTEIAREAAGLIDQYMTMEPSELSDEDLAVVAPKLSVLADQLQNVKECTDYLTWGIYKANQAAEILGNEETSAMEAGYNAVTDDRSVADAINAGNKIALYKQIVAGPLSDEIKTVVNYEAGTKIVVDGVYTDMTGEEEAANGVDLTGYIQNPRFYTFTTDGSATLEDNTVVGWSVDKYDGCGVHLANNASATEAKPVITSAINAYAGGAEYDFYQVIENAPVGVYNVYFATRTAIKNNADGDGVKGVFNAQDDDTELWDKYIYAQVDDEEPIIAPFAAGSSWFGHATVVPNVTVKKGQKLTIGVVEHYISGKASGHDFDPEAGEYTATDRWNTNTFAGEARLYFVAPLEGFDYAAEIEEVETDIEQAEVADEMDEAQGGVIVNVAGQQVNENYKGIIIKGTKKYLNW